MSKRRFGFIMVTFGVAIGVMAGAWIGYSGHDAYNAYTERVTEKSIEVQDKIDRTLVELENIWL